ncbi:hypothetical protein Droror1_Dr00011051 [Drosera rotundifolia]
MIVNNISSINFTTSMHLKPPSAGCLHIYPPISAPNKEIKDPVLKFHQTSKRPKHKAVEITKLIPLAATREEQKRKKHNRTKQNSSTMFPFLAIALIVNPISS